MRELVLRSVVSLPAGVLAILLAIGEARPVAAEPRFRDAADRWGIDFRHHHGGSGERYMVETMVGGVVLFDYDGDGDDDLFFVDGGELPGYEGEPPRSRLFRTELGAGDGEPRFTDVTEQAGLKVDGYGCGGSAADVDGDGDLDLYVTALGANRLFRNHGDGTFSEVGVSAGVAIEEWSAAAAFADPDRDGDLDLYVSNYVDFTVATHRPCKVGEGEEAIAGYCHPSSYDGLADRLLRNRGDGSFEDATAAAGLSGAVGPGLGAVFGDLDNDGWPDLYVANDAEPNFLLRNRGLDDEGKVVFEDQSLLSGTSHSDRGAAEAGMGVDIGDVDGNGFFDIVVTNFALETNALYKNSGATLFIDGRFPSGLGEPSLLYLAFGVAFADFDHDGDLDVTVANGHVQDNADQLSDSGGFAQRNQVFEGMGHGRFREVTEHGIEAVRVSRGLALADLDRDGDLDVVIANSNDRAEVYENLAGDDRWLQVAPRSPSANRFAVGARLELGAGARKQIREVRTSTSYLSQSTLDVHFGLGAEGRAERLRVRWPAGGERIYLDPPAARRIVVYDP